MDQPYRGPTVYGAAEALIRKNKQLIADLQDEIKRAEARLRTLHFCGMLECERIATQMEAFMDTQLFENQPEDLTAVETL